MSNTMWEELTPRRARLIVAGPGRRFAGLA
jgi:hypothetical protein